MAASGDTDTGLVHINVCARVRAPPRLDQRSSTPRPAKQPSHHQQSVRLHKTDGVAGEASGGPTDGVITMPDRAHDSLADGRLRCVPPHEWAV
jgi:hypothetical protein